MSKKNKDQKKKEDQIEKPNDPTADDAAVKAAKVEHAGELKELIVKEAMSITDGKTISVQQLMAYCRRLKACDKYKN